MSKKSNQKHLTLEPTISKEVRFHARIMERPDTHYTNPPCTNRKTCKLTFLCNRQCGILCKICNKQDMQCIDLCPNYRTAECEKFKNLPMSVTAAVRRHTALCQDSFILPSIPTMLPGYANLLQGRHQPDAGKHLAAK